MESYTRGWLHSNCNTKPGTTQQSPQRPLIRTKQKARRRVQSLRHRRLRYLCSNSNYFATNRIDYIQGNAAKDSDHSLVDKNILRVKREPRTASWSLLLVSFLTNFSSFHHNGCGFTITRVLFSSPLFVSPAPSLLFNFTTTSLRLSIERYANHCIYYLPTIFW